MSITNFAIQSILLSVELIFLICVSFSSRFESDFSNTGDGFHLEYEIQGCGGILNKPEGSFTSPNYPKPYPNETHCQWIIEAEYGNLVEITFVDFDFEATIDCAQDGLVVRFF